MPYANKHLRAVRSTGAAESDPDPSRHARRDPRLQPGPGPVRDHCRAVVWFPAFFFALIVALMVAVYVEMMGYWLVNETVMAVRLFLIGAPIWVALYGTIGTIYRQGKWIIEVTHEAVEVQWRRLGSGSTWKIPLRALSGCTVSGSPLKLALHFRDGNVMILDARAHFRGHLKPLADAIEAAAAREKNRPAEPMPEPPKALLAMLSREKAAS